MENLRKVWYDQNDQPPKNYIWYKNGQYLEWIDGRWKESKGLNSGDNNSIKRYTVDDLSEIENPKNGELASTLDKEWVYDGDFSNIIAFPENITNVTLALKKPLSPQEDFENVAFMGGGLIPSLLQNEFPVEPTAGFMIYNWPSETVGSASDYFSLTGIIKGQDYEYYNGEWNIINGVSQKYSVVNEPFTLATLNKSIGSLKEGDIMECTEQIWKLENLNSTITFPSYSLFSARNIRLIHKDNLIPEETASRTLNIYLNNTLILTFSHSGYELYMNNIYDNILSKSINLQPSETRNTDIVITNYIPSILESSNSISGSTITVTEEDDGTWSILDAWDIGFFSKPVYYEKVNGSLFIRQIPFQTNTSGIYVVDEFDMVKAMTGNTLQIVKSDCSIYLGMTKIGNFTPVEQQ